MTHGIVKVERYQRISFGKICPAAPVRELIGLHTKALDHAFHSVGRVGFYIHQIVNGKAALPHCRFATLPL